MQTTFTKSEIFTMAWQMARALATTAGTGPKAQFATALKATYASIKENAEYAAQEAQDRSARLANVDEEIEEVEATLKALTRRSTDRPRLHARLAALWAEARGLLA